MLLNPLHFLRRIIGVEEETCKNIMNLETRKKLQVDMCYCTVRWGAARTPFPQYHYGEHEESTLQAARVRSPKTLKGRDFPPSALMCGGILPILNRKPAATR